MISAIVVDDEPKAIRLIEGYLSHFSTVKLLATFRTGLKAFEFMQSAEVDLIFLDINMPQLSGISLARMIDPRVDIIFTTAYSDYAVESYDVSALDYLTKPITMERFTKAMAKVLAQHPKSESHLQRLLLIKSGVKVFRVDPDEIYYLEKDGNYLTYYLEATRIVARESIGEALAALPDYFVQTHKSFIANTKRVKAFSKDSLSISASEIPIGASYKNLVLAKLARSIY